MNYYEMLQLAPTASMAEIQAACDARLSKWQALVTHHDPQMVAQANEQLRTLETIRATLTDPAKRAGYDAALGQGEVAPLVDPDARFRGGSPPPPRSAAGSVPTATGLWQCPKCQVENPPQTTFCFKCGTQIVAECLWCREQAVLLATGFCGKCGLHHANAEKKVELRSQQNELNKHIYETTWQIESLDVQYKARPPLYFDFGCLFGWLVLAAVLAWGVLLAVVFFADVVGSGGELIFIGVVLGVLVFFGIMSLAFNNRRGYRRKIEQQIQEQRQRIDQAKQRYEALEQQLTSIKPGDPA